MKLKNLVGILVVIIGIGIFGCNKDKDNQSYDVDTIAVVNAEGMRYFYSIFREAENAWAVVDSLKYVSGSSIVEKKSENSKTSKVTTYNKIGEETETTLPAYIITIEYNSWVVGGKSLLGKIIVTLPLEGYRNDNRMATIRLNDFSIQGQRINGTTEITYANGPEEGIAGESYAYRLSEGKIYAADDNGVVITADITGGRFTRTKGETTIKYTDDEWLYTGTMKGILYDDPGYNYTNTVYVGKLLASNGTETNTNGITYLPDCASDGRSIIEIKGQPQIQYQYMPNCSYYIMSVEDIGKII